MKGQAARVNDSHDDPGDLRQSQQILRLSVAQPGILPDRPGALGWFSKAHNWFRVGPRPRDANNPEPMPSNPGEIDPKAELTAEQAASLLAWYVASGADEAFGETPINRFETPSVAKGDSPSSQVQQKSRQQSQQQADMPGLVTRQLPSAASPAASRPVAAAPLPDHTLDALASARELATAATSLAELNEAVERFEGCGLKATAHSTVFCDGNPKARIMLVGEAPGREEDRQGRPFVGPAGQLLDKMFGAIGLNRADEDPDKSIYIANILPWRPPGNRNPSAEEIALCLPFLQRHIELQAPAIIVALGGVSSKQLLDTSTGIMRTRGRWAEIAVGDRQVPVLPMFHPAYLLRQPAQKRYAWSDLQSLRDRIAAL